MKVIPFAFVLALFSAAVNALKYPPQVAAMIDDSVNPCDDFYQYACGGWFKSYKLPAGRNSYSYAFTGIGDTNRKAVVSIHNQNKPIIGDLYQSCMNVDLLDRLGTKPIEAFRRRLVAVKDKKTLFVLAGELALKGLSFLSGVGTGPDPKDAARSIFMAVLSGTTLSDPRYYIDKSTWAQYEEAFRSYVTKTFVMIGYDDATAAELSTLVIELEHQVAAIVIPKDPSSDPSSRYNAMTVEQAIVKYPHVVGAFLDGINVLETTRLRKNDTMLFQPSLRSYDAIEMFVESTDLEALKALFEFQFVNDVSQYMGEPFLTARFDLYGKALSGQTTRPPREKDCARVVETALPALFGKYYFEANLDQKSEKKARDIMKSIERVMKKRLQQSPWLDDETRGHALEKLAKVTNLVGHAKEVEPLNENSLGSTTYLANMEVIRKFRTQQGLNNINKPIDRTQWSLSAADVNAHFSDAENKVTFPAGILQPPFFKGSNLPAQNFGAIGVIMGHELTHGFDSSGRKYDGDGNLAPWWTNAASAEFEKRAQCLIDQYSRFELHSDLNSSVLIGNVNGRLTITENIADNGGLGLSFEAFHELMAKQQPQQQQRQQQKAKQKQGQQQVNGKPKPVPSTSTPVDDVSLKHGLSFDALHELNTQQRPGKQRQQQQQEQNGKPKQNQQLPKSKPKLVSTKSKPADDVSLHDMDRLFFISYAQAWCSKRADSSAHAMLKTDEHSPDRFRIIGAVQNNPHFGKLFNCKVGTYMNPKDKCEVW